MAAIRIVEECAPRRETATEIQTVRPLESGADASFQQQLGQPLLPRQVLDRSDDRGTHAPAAHLGKRKHALDLAQFRRVHLERPQADRLARCLKLLGDGGYFRVVLIHHPPNQEQAHPRLGLYGAKLFRKAVADHGAELILHGHTHQSSIYAIPGPTGDVPVVGVAAAGAAQGDTGGHDPARYNLFSIQRVGTAWQCTLREFGFQRLSPDIVLRLSLRIY